jgi:mono/diheme cytochrome c family protein
VAYLDVESAAYPWPKLNGVDIGPLRLQWGGSEKSGIRESQWTYSITAIDIVQTPASRLAAIRPSPDLAADSPVLEGFVTFQRVCFSCHTLNGAGDSQLGPDLNFPYSPVEYLGDERLLAYLREPQSLHL